MAAAFKRFAAKIAVAFAKQIEEHNGGRSLLGEKLHSRRGRMKAKLQRIEVEPALRCYDDFAIQNATRWQLVPQRIHYLGKVTIERLFVAALNQDFVSVAKNDRPKAIPFRLKYPGAALRQLTNSLREHWQDRRINRKLHVSHAIPCPCIMVF